MVFSVILIFLSDQLSGQCLVSRLLRSTIAGLLYPLLLTATSLYFTGRELFIGQQNEAADTKLLNLYKLFEHILEAFPQLLIGIVYIANNGGPGPNYVQTVSAVFSSGSLIFGIVTGCEACFVIYSFRYKL